MSQRSEVRGGRENSTAPEKKNQVHNHHIPSLAALPSEEFLTGRDLKRLPQLITPLDIFLLNLFLPGACEAEHQTVVTSHPELRLYVESVVCLIRAE